MEYDTGIARENVVGSLAGQGDVSEKGENEGGHHNEGTGYLTTGSSRTPAKERRGYHRVHPGRGEMEK